MTPYNQQDVVDYSPQIQREEKKILQITHRTLDTLSSAEDIGIVTNKELQKQGEALRRTEKKLNKIDQDVKVSRKHLQNLGSCTSAFFNRLRRIFVSSPPPLDSVNNDSLYSFEDRKEFTQLNKANSNPGKTVHLHAQSIAANEESTSGEINNNLDLMSERLTRMKDIALAMGTEIHSQNQDLDRINETIETSNTNLSAGTKTATKLLR